MDASRKRELIVHNDGHKLDDMVEECCAMFDSGNTDELTLKVPLKHATRAISLLEILRRRFSDVVAKSEITNLFGGCEGADRRKTALLVIRITRPNARI